jgi:hypothetical protein
MAGNSGSTGAGRKNLLITLAVVMILIAGGATAYVFPTASNQGYAPEQPIPFSHALHAGQKQIACMYCHVSVEKSRHATVPSLNVCMNCHTVVKTGSPYIKQIQKAWKEGRPIEWVRVHELPDHVYFPHKRHVAAGVSCETCHGNVKGMERIYQKSALTMGWCIRCHRGETTPHDILEKFYPELATNPNAPHEGVAPTQCSTCHK